MTFYDSRFKCFSKVRVGLPGSLVKRAFLLFLALLSVSMPLWALAVSSSDHPHNGVQVPLTQYLNLETTSTFTFGQGNISLFNIDSNEVDAYFEAGDPHLSMGALNLSLHLPDKLKSNTSYALLVDASLLQAIDSTKVISHIFYTNNPTGTILMSYFGRDGFLSNLSSIGFISTLDNDTPLSYTISLKLMIG
jgi:hypothetical protein